MRAGSCGQRGRARGAARLGRVVLDELRGERWLLGLGRLGAQLRQLQHLVLVLVDVFLVEVRRLLPRLVVVGVLPALPAHLVVGGLGQPLLADDLLDLPAAVAHAPDGAPAPDVRLLLLLEQRRRQPHAHTLVHGAEGLVVALAEADVAHGHLQRRAAVLGDDLGVVPDVARVLGLHQVAPISTSLGLRKVPGITWPAAR